MPNIKASLKLRGFWIRRTLFTLCAIIAAAFIWACLWRYAPVHIRVAAIEKVLVKDAKESDREDCARFTMTPQEFAEHFATLKRILPDETEEYGFGECYYKTTITGKTYVIWQGRAAEIWANGDTAYYASDKYRFVPAEEGSHWRLPW